MAIGGSLTKFLAAAALLSAGVLGLASPAGAATTLKVDAGYAGSYVPGRPMPVRVQVAADRLVSGELQVVVDGVTTSAPVEVPGGSAKEFLVVVGTNASRSSPVTVIAQLPDGSKSPPSANLSVNPVDDQEVVGLLPGVLAGRSAPGPAALSVDVGTARFVALSSAELDRAPDSIRALGTIAAGADELGRLAPSTRTGVLQWIEGGGRLLVDASPGAPVVGLPDAWQPGAGNRARAGAGEVRLTSGAMGAGRWSGLIEPTPRAGPSNTNTFGGPPLGDSLAQDAGFRIPHLSWLVAFLAVYVIVVGPALYIVLRRRRRPELAWIAIPLVAVVFTGASWAGGRNLRTSTQIVHGTVLSTGATGSTAITYLGVSSRSGGTLRIGWPPGWLNAPDERTVQAVGLDSMRLTPAGPEGRLPLDANQFGLVAAQGPVAPGSGALEITAVSAGDGQARGTIRNGTKLHMDRAAVLLASAGAEVGPLAPGESREWSVAANNGFGGPPAEALIMGRNPDGQSFTSFSLWEVAQRAGLGGGGDPGQALAVGWTSDYRPSVRVGGATTHPAGKTLVLGPGPVSVDGTRASDLTFQREVLRTNRGVASVVGFAAPSGNLTGGRTVEAGKLMIRVPILPVEVWTGDTWTPVSCAGCPSAAPNPVQAITRCPPNGPCVAMTVPMPVFPGQAGSGQGVETRLPAESLRDGMIYVRFPQGGFGFSNDSSFAVREAA